MDAVRGGLGEVQQRYVWRCGLWLGSGTANDQTATLLCVCLFRLARRRVALAPRTSGATRTWRDGSCLRAGAPVKAGVAGPVRAAGDGAARDTGPGGGDRLGGRARP
jgi:hypothetical protein